MEQIDQGVKEMRKNSSFTGTALLICLGATLLFGVAGARQFNVNAQCVSNAQVAAQALRGYVQDYDETFPPTMTGVAFRRALAPYIKDPWLWRLYCPATHLPYSTNAAFGGQKLAGLNLPDPSLVPIFWDPVPHRDGKSTVAFMDGHVERGGVDAADPNVECVGNARALAVGVLMYAQDYDGLLPPMNTSDQFEQSVRPYAGSFRTFLCPATHLPYAPNAALSETPVNSYPNPGGVVVLADPKPHRDGKSTVGFLDGHVVRK
jgi:prepilin-type processing-associated H-X9-DG protein